MAQQCQECGASVDGARWCGACGALLEAGQAGPATDAGRGDAGDRSVRVAVATIAVAAIGAVVVTSAGQTPPSPLPERQVPVEEAEVVTPSLPPAGVARQQFAPRGSILWERTDLPTSSTATPAVVTDGSVVVVVEDGEAVVAVDAATGQGVAVPPPPAPGADDPTFTVDGEELHVEVDGTILRGVVAGEARWEVSLGGAPAVPPVRTGTSLVAVLSTGEVVAIAPADGSQRWRRDLGSDATSVAGDGTVLLVGTVDGRVLRLDPSGTPVTAVQAGEGPVRAVAAGRPAAALLEDRLVGVDVTGG